MHSNMSLSTKDGKNAFYDQTDELGLSKIAYNYIAGLVKHAKGIAAITNPLVNSYKRLVPGYEAPVYIAWSCKNRSPLIRIPASRGGGTRVELRNPDAAANPYLVLAVALAAGLDGIKKGLTPPAPTDSNIYQMTEAERKEKNIDNLPANLEDAIALMEQDSLAKETLGEHLFGKYIEAKKVEWDNYRTRVHQWEVDSYLTKY